MRLKITESKNSKSFYVIKSIYNPKTKGNTSKIVGKLGNEKEILEKYNVSDAKVWALSYVEKLNKKEKEEKALIPIYFAQNKLINDNQRVYNAGYLPLKFIFYSLGLDKICKKISDRNNFVFNLESILSRLIYTRILIPGSKLNAFEESKKFIEQPNFDLHQIYRALDVLNKESDYIFNHIINHFRNKK